jgi:hypothetical protein
MVMDELPVVKVDSLRVAFDDERLVSDAGLMLPASLAGRLGVEALVNETLYERALAHQIHGPDHIAA